MQNPPLPLPALSSRLADTWAATDALGRPLPHHREVGSPQPGRTVGILYSLGFEQEPPRPRWGEPELGDYASTDERVLQRHVRLLADAGVDVLILDVSQGKTYPTAVKALCKVLRELRAQGESTPQFCFFTRDNTTATVEALDREVYFAQLAPELWFQWEGKPLLLARPSDVPEDLRSFFSLRESQAWTKNQAWFEQGRGKWPWIDLAPQEPGRTPRGRIEQLAVGAAPSPAESRGRSFHHGSQPSVELWRPELGLCFAEQWDRALEVKPNFVFVASWNEWSIAGSAEFSRDIEPMKGGHTDNYYYQLVANIRRFKGARPTPPLSPPKTIQVNGEFSDWAKVQPTYHDPVNDALAGNDIRLCKVARDKENLYFAAVCTAVITPRRDAAGGLTLYLDTDQNGRTGWHGANFRVASRQLEKWTGAGWSVVCPIALETSGTRLELAIPRRRLGQQARVALDFHWSEGEGERAPDRRFQYRYEEAP